MACQAETTHLVPAGTPVVHSAEALTLRDMCSTSCTLTRNVRKQHFSLRKWAVSGGHARPDRRSTS
eukprot:869015-Prymnesium_polylepis.1